MNPADAAALEARNKRLRAEQEAYIANLAKGGTGRQMQSSIAGASSKTSETYRQALAQEEARQRKLAEAAASALKDQAFKEDAEARKQSLEEQRNKNKNKRDKKKARAAANKRERSGSRSGSDAEDAPAQVEAPQEVADNVCSTAVELTVAAQPTADEQTN